jgi:hypothetical protein
VGVRKFRTFEDARQALWLPAGDPSILLAMRRLGRLAIPRPCEPGVVRYRSVEEAKADKRLASTRRRT